MKPTLMILIRIITQNSDPRLQAENISSVYENDSELTYVNKYRVCPACHEQTVRRGMVMAEQSRIRIDG